MPPMVIVAMGCNSDLSQSLWMRERKIGEEEGRNNNNQQEQQQQQQQKGKKLSGVRACVISRGKDGWDDG
ncbi:hypothetical protein BVC80_551g25 [Macleaya cordata]|uniref:Uncharacterized protein n=1 Tax=Macleaya cordata TaxID=56857 RepID=A0A200QE65_MACCD|nr:hypothetical protein BVC80_551g25 [Macleaya cordata]